MSKTDEMVNTLSIKMAKRSASRRAGWMFILVKFLFASALFIASTAPSLALAQSTDDVWTKPLNISHSGVATNPAMVTDSVGDIHVVWQDDVANFVYTRFHGDQWSAPKTTNLNDLFMLPAAGETSRGSETQIYTGANPLFISGPGEYIFAFWLSPQGRLWTSKVKNPDFDRVGAWDSPSLISHAASFTVVIDALGEWHLAYVRTDEEDPANPAGIYYTHSKNGGQIWTVPTSLYESPYFRTLGVGEANLSLATAGTGDTLRVYLAWDNRPRKQVFFAQSPDGGKSWEKPAQVAGPAPESGVTSPFNIQVGATLNSVVLVWQSGQPGAACNQVYQSSNDAGATWSDPQTLIQDLLGCEGINEFVRGSANRPKDPLYFLTETKSQVYLAAWDGHQWVQPQEQSLLSGFEEPQIYTQVVYGCHRASMLGQRLYVVGCDQSGGGDVWVTSRFLGSDTSWSKPPVWSQLSSVTSEKLKMEAVVLATTDDGLMHAFFSQHQDPTIYYAGWNGESWSRITPVLKPQEGEAAWPAIVAEPGKELYLFATTNRGMLYFSRGTSGTASIESSWSTPARVAIAQDGEIGSVAVGRDAAGTLYVAYSVPVNDKRGIYLIQSKDHGTSWSAPLRLFNGVAANYDLVGAPSLLISPNGSVHVIWDVQSIRGDGIPQPLSLYYSRSEDGGHTFGDAGLLVDEAVGWREIVTDGKGNLHLLWQQDGFTTAWDQISLDGGHTWQYPQGLPDAGRLAAVTKDPEGSLHLVGVGSGELGHWLWDGSRWNPEAHPSWSLSSQQASSMELLETAVNKLGKMMVVLAGPTSEGDEAQRTLLYSIHSLELQPTIDAIPEVATQTLSATTLSPATPTSAHLSTPTSLVGSEATESQGRTDGNETNNGPSPFTIALLPVALLLLGVLGVVIRQAARAKDR